MTSSPVLPARRTGLPFLKVEGLGNDFLLIDLRDRDPGALAEIVEQLQQRAPALCDRRTGVGGDGLLLVTPPRRPGSTGTMLVINHDGSRPEMCGNGLRCVALHLADGPTTLQVDTDAGVRLCHVRPDASGQAGEVEVDMGHAEPLGPRTVGGRSFAAFSLGNPHAVAFVAPGEDPEQLARTLGPRVETDPQFPARTNVEFARREADGSLTLWVWERGCGITDACGTGACATLAAAVAEGLAPTGVPVRVQLPGGPLLVRLDDGRVWMTGPARVVFRGEVLAGDR
ncbi:MAG TPA: diaminopimelate epimerase [Nannocystis sp.]